MSYRNPVISGFHPDPSICRVGKDFYLVTSSFEYFPGVPLFHSTNLVDWEQIGHVLTRDSQLPLKDCWASGGIYAPTLRYHDGRFYMVTTNTNGAHVPNGHFYVWTDDIRGEWSEPIRVDMKGIDPDLFFDDDGSVWFSCTNGQSRIDIETGKLIGEPTVRWPGMGGNAYPEAPHLYKINGYYFTMLAEGGTEPGHMVTIARSNKVGGPYEPCPHNPILTHRSTTADLQSTGHGDLVQDEHGRWWMVFLATRLLGYPKFHFLGRETCLAPVTWTDDGWPVVNEGQIVRTEMTLPGLPDQRPRPREWIDEFDGASLKPEWNFLRNPDPGVWSLAEHPGCLTLRCAPVSLDSVGSPAWVGRRLQHFETESLVELEFEPRGDDEEAGLTAFLQQFAHYDLAVTQRGGRRVVMVRRTVGTLCLESAPLPIPEGPVTLSIKSDKEWFDLGVVTREGRVSVARGEARFLSTEVSGRFTGVYMAMYAKSAGDPSSMKNAGRFERFVYRHDE